MKLPARTGLWLLPFLLTGCFHRHHQAQNVPIAPPLQQPEPNLKTTPVELPSSASTIPTEPTENAQAPASPETPKPHPRHRKPAPSKPAQTEVASNGTPGVSAIGQLSSGDPANYRQQTEESILTIEKGLNGINRSLSAPEQKTADHIREFLKEARTALASGDVDGAHTLAAKAKVLLAELTK